MKKKLACVLLAIVIIAKLGKVSAQTITYEDKGQKLVGLIAKPSGGGTAPGVLVIHAWMGVNDFIKDVCNKLSLEGYIAMAADIYGAENKPSNVTEARRQSGIYKSDRALYRQRIQAGISKLIESGADPQNIAVIGYCFGGTGALEAARANLNIKGAISFHGGLEKGKEITDSREIKPKVLVLHGAIDPSVPESQAEAFRKEMTASKADWQMIYYADAVHAFTEPAAGDDPSKGAAYNARAATRSWHHATLFLKELFAD